jgi:hypothetical protein
METGSKVKYKKSGKSIQYTLISKPNIEGNKVFLLALDENLRKLPRMNLEKREKIIEELSMLDVPMMFYSPIYFALALYYMEEDIKDIDDEFMENIVSRLLPVVSEEEKILRRKIGIYRYVRFLTSLR